MLQVERAGVCELAAGGVFYVVGVVFFKSDGLVPFAHAIWHLFVAAGAGIHYYAIWTYLYVPGPLLQTSRWQAGFTLSDWTRKSLDTTPEMICPLALTAVYQMKFSSDGTKPPLFLY